MLSYLATGAHVSVTMTRLGEDNWGIVIGPSHGLHSVRAATAPDHRVPSVAAAVHRTTCQARALLAHVTTVMRASVNWANSSTVDDVPIEEQQRSARHGGREVWLGALVAHRGPALVTERVGQVRTPGPAS